MKKYRQLFVNSTLNSYSTVFFSNNKLFALLIMLITFFNVSAGFSGLIAVVITNLIAYWMGYNETSISKGSFAFNSLLVGLGLGVTYEFSLAFALLLFLSAIFTLFLTISLEGIIGKYALPFLSLPFLFAIWLFFVATQNFQSLQLSEHEIYMYNEIYNIGGMGLVNKYNQLNALQIPISIVIYFKSLGAIFFQYTLIAGIIIALGLLIYSRIAFSLSLLGFYTAYLFNIFIGVNLNEYDYSFIGFNFILTAIAIGGFFIVPSKASYFWVILLVPLIAIVTAGSNSVFVTYHLAIYSLPFNVIVLLFLYILKFRTKNTLRIEEVFIQHYSPEKNLYLHQNSKKRFRNSYYFPVSLPFWGNWNITQGHSGSITHQAEWKHAWDFEIKDETNKTYSNAGVNNEDFYSFNKPIIAPAEGIVEEVVNSIEDNKIGDVNLNENWGNTIIIKHTALLYSKLSHLKKDSIKVNKGDYVKKGEIIAACGNTGRSPEPHLHFQFQATPHIGSTTIEFPLCYYISSKGNEYNFKQFAIPKEGETIANIEKNTLLSKAFHFIPGQKINFIVRDFNTKAKEEVSWEVFTDYYNNSYIQCNKTKSKAYFVNDGTVFYFKHFEGNKKSLLFYFYLASYKMLLGFYKNLAIKDQFPVNQMNNKLLLLLQDFIAPFYVFMKTDFNSSHQKIDDTFNTNYIKFKSNAEYKVFNSLRKRISFSLSIKSNCLFTLIIKDNNKIVEATCID